MKRIILPTSLVLAAALLTGCSADSGSVQDPVPTASSSATDRTTTASVDSALSAFTGDLSPDEVYAANHDYTTVTTDEWSSADAVSVQLSGTSGTIPSGATGISIADGMVSVTSAGVYEFSGNFSGGIVVAAPEDAQVVIILNGVTIANSHGAAIEVQSADDVAIHLADGSQNSVSDAESYAADAEANAAIYSASDLTVSGNGALAVLARGNDGITSKDDLVILSGTITVTASDDALRGKDSLVVSGGTLDLTAESGDGLKSDQENDETKGYILVTGGTVSVTAGDDGIQAYTDTIITGGDLSLNVADDGVKAEKIVSIAGGDLKITDSYEGIEANFIGIFDGAIDVVASDDGINASGINTGGQDRETDTGERLEVSGGTINVNAGFDGFDSNGKITISGGTINIVSADNGGDSPLDANGEVTVTGGTITANGAAYDPATAQQRGPAGGPGGPEAMPGF